MSADKISVDEVDHMVLGIFTSLAKAAVQNASKSVQRVLSVSQEFLSTEAHEALRNFHDLYFSSEPAPTNHNDDVDRIFEAAAGVVAQGVDVDQGLRAITVDSDREHHRLALSGLQKKLESVIAMEQNFREKVGPILSGMQFEDAMCQRVDHLEFAWTQIVTALHQKTPDFAEAAAAIAKKLSSDAERQIYYRGVLKEEPPPQLEETGIWLDFAA